MNGYPSSSIRSPVLHARRRGDIGADKHAVLGHLANDSGPSPGSPTSEPVSSSSTACFLQPACLLLKSLHALPRRLRLEFALRQDARERNLLARQAPPARSASAKSSARLPNSPAPAAPHTPRAASRHARRPRNSPAGSRPAAAAARSRPAPPSAAPPPRSEYTVTLRIATSAVTPSVIASRHVTIAVGRCQSSFQISLFGVIVTSCLDRHFPGRGRVRVPWRHAYFVFWLCLQFGSLQHLPAACSLAAIWSSRRARRELADQHARRRHDDQRRARSRPPA